MWSIHISCSQQISVETFFYTHVTVASACTRKRYVAVASTSRWFTYMYCLCISTIGMDDWMALAIDKHVRYLAHFQAFPSSRFDHLQYVKMEGKEILSIKWVMSMSNLEDRRKKDSNQENTFHKCKLNHIQDTIHPVTWELLQVCN